MRVGIICAGDREVAPLISMIKDPVVSEKAMLKFYSGTIEDVSIVTLFCGVCKTNAAIATQILIDVYACDIVVNAGTAGGMDTKIKLFDTIISTEVCHHDVHEGILTEFHPWLDSIFFQADKQLVELSKQAVQNSGITNVYWGRMVTGEAFVEGIRRNEINRKFSPLCVDMETASIAQVCYVNKIPFVSVRTITDTAEHKGLDNFDMNCRKASEISADIVSAILKQMKFADESQRA